MQSFWDARARENAMYFVDNNVDYHSPDAERFWAEGERAVDTILAAVGVELRSGDEVVEIGCGLGRLTRALAGRARSVTALDLSAEMLARAREANAGLHNVRWLHGDGTSLAGVDDASADVCFSLVVFQHIPDPQITLGYIREMGRVLRPRGWAAFQISNDPSIHRPRSGGRWLARRALAVVGRAPQGQDDPAWLGSAVDLDELRENAESVAMRVEKVTGAGTQFCFVLLRKG